MQKSSPAVLFCNECLQELCERLCSNVLCEAVNNAYTTLSEPLARALDSKQSHERLS